MMIEPYYSTQNFDFTLYQGDSFEVLHNIKGSFDMIFADPPYFLSTGNGKVNVNGQYIKFDKGQWDRVRSRDEKDAFNRNWLETCTKMLKQNVRLVITEVNRGRKRVVGSIRRVLQSERKAAAEKVWNEIEVGKHYKGVVKSMTGYGAFIDIGGVDGMVHVSELSWNRIKQPSDVLKIGDEVEVYVLGFDKEQHRISLGYKDPEKNPWNIFKNSYSVGDVAKVKIVKLMPFGAFAEIQKEFVRFRKHHWNYCAVGVGQEIYLFRDIFLSVADCVFL